MENILTKMLNNLCSKFSQEGIFTKTNVLRTKIVESHRDNYFQVKEFSEGFPEEMLGPVFKTLKQKGSKQLRNSKEVYQLNEDEMFYTHDVLDNLVQYFQNDIATWLQDEEYFHQFLKYVSNNYKKEHGDEILFRLTEFQLMIFVLAMET